MHWFSPLISKPVCLKILVVSNRVSNFFFLKSLGCCQFWLAVYEGVQVLSLSCCCIKLNCFLHFQLACPRMLKGIKCYVKRILWKSPLKQNEQNHNCNCTGIAETLCPFFCMPEKAKSTMQKYTVLFIRKTDFSYTV